MTTESKQPPISPSIGRQVWYRPIGEDVDGQACAATVVYVHSDTSVNLAVLDSVGKLHQMQFVRLVQPSEVRPICGNFCEWMPYQISSASK